jgi:selenocysteine lyase/cysteine desulfurase
MMNRTALLTTEAFTGLQGLTHLATGGESPWLKTNDAVYAEFSRLKSFGEPGRAKIYAYGENCRGKLGRLWSVPANRIAFMPFAAEGMAWLARGLDWRAGDNVVTTELEFPSVAYSWQPLRKLGVALRRVRQRVGRITEADLLAAVDERTRVLAVSQVSFYSGQCLQIEQLADGLKADNPATLLAVDATHAAGVVQVPAARTDLCISSAYKWLLSTHGIAPCYVSERAERLVGETRYGWHNVSGDNVYPEVNGMRSAEPAHSAMPSRLEPGNPAMVVVLFLNRALDVLLDIGIDRIAQHARGLSALCREGLQGMGYKVISPGDVSAMSGNTCFLVEDASQLRNRLSEKGVLVWGEHGRVRVSTHLYNSSEDVQHLLAVLRELR